MLEVSPKLRITCNILQKQNQLQDKQIKQLAKYLNLTMHQVDRHSEMLYEMDTKMLIMNSTLQHLMWNIDSMQYEANILHYFWKLEYIEYILPCMLFEEILIIYLNI